MRTALISAIDRTEDGQHRAFLELAGRTIVSWQVELARALGCERIVCLCEGPSPALIDVQRDAELEGLMVNFIRGPMQLVGLLSADHELVVIADGLLPDQEIAARLFSQGRGVATLPAEAGIAAGFERIDAANAWGGLFVARGNIVERLADLPPDADTVSILLRLALQAGSRTIAIDTAWLHSGEWLLVSEPGQLASREKALLEAYLPPASWSGPGSALASRLARRFAPAALDRGPLALGGVASASAIGAIWSAAQELPFAAMVLLTISAFIAAIGGSLSKLKSSLLRKSKSGIFLRHSRELFDIAAIASLTLPATVSMLPQRAFLPVILIGLVRLAEGVPKQRWRTLWRDRVMLGIVLAPAAWFGVLSQTMAVLCLVALVFCLIFKPVEPITTD